jgi:hypothetical protein
VHRPELDRGVEIGHCRLYRLARQRIHQVEVEVIDPRRAQLFGREPRFTRAVDPPEHCEPRVVEALRTKRNTVNARGPVFGEASVLDGARDSLRA